MSGPIVRRYGFPNFDKIFGERALQHGVEEPEQPEAPAEESEAQEQQKPTAKKKATGRGAAKSKKP
jgi:hypothetical protein